MKNRILALLLIAVLMISLCACQSADDEEGAAVDTIVTSKDDETENEQQDKTEEESEEETEEESEDEPETEDQPETENEPEEEPETEQSPEVSTEGDYTVKFDYGFNNKTQTEKTSGKATELKINRDGYEFDGWYDGNQKWNFSDNVTSDITLTAKWNAIEYTITYQLDGAQAEAGNPEKYTISDSAIELKPATKKGKLFTGWSIDNGKNTITSTSIPAGTFGNLNLKPVWDENAILFGTYEQDNDESTKDAIAWVKLTEKDGKALLISKNILDAKAFNSSGGEQFTWSNCELRTWCYSTFYNKAFTSDEKAAIIEIENSTTGTYNNVTTKDRVFLLSLEEVKEYMTSYASRKATVTAYAEANGAQNSPSGGWWWTRSKASPYYASLIENDGNIRTGGYQVIMTTIGVRPAIWVDLSKLG